jgi:Cytochrome c7 and related cytochrome c
MKSPTVVFAMSKASNRDQQPTWSEGTLAKSPEVCLSSARPFALEKRTAPRPSVAATNSTLLNAHRLRYHLPHARLSRDLDGTGMSALFKPSANTGFRVAIFALALLGGGGLIAGPMIYVRTPFFTQQQDPIDQPVQFDHRHHVGDEGIDCRYCHYLVEKTQWAGVPPTSLCLNCHEQIWNKSPKLAPVRESYFADKPIVWNKVNKLPHFVYFNHSIHVKQGVGCVTCHGRIDEMAAVEKAQPLTMGWCLECHRQPERFLRPREEITSMTWKPKGDQLELGRSLKDQYHVQTRTSCSTCHR